MADPLQKHLDYLQNILPDERSQREPVLLRALRTVWVEAYNTGWKEAKDHATDSADLFPDTRQHKDPA